jgi:hypothetical protein
MSSTIVVNSDVEMYEIANGIGVNQDLAFDLIVRLVENIADESFDQRVINMLQEG